MIGKECINDAISSMRGDARVVAAFFSTFTFGREFFEREVLIPFCDEGSTRGLIPVTVVVDRSQYRGNGYGYQVVQSPRNRLWHAKVILLMLQENGTQERRTIFGMGSANLTRSGWEQNDELVSLKEWDGWRIPAEVWQWLKQDWIQNCGFASWVRKNPKNVSKIIGSPTRYSSLISPIWGQMNWVSNKKTWGEAHIVAPFYDSRALDGDVLESITASDFFLDVMARHRKSQDAELHLYLCPATQGGDVCRVIGNRAVLKKLAKCVNLHLHLVKTKDNGRFHAKMMAFRHNGSWSIITGSPNATGPAFIQSGGNIELAQERNWSGRQLPRGLLPESKPISIDRLRFIKPVLDNPRTWDALKRVVYNPTKRKLHLTWRPGHSLSDTILLFGSREIRPDVFEMSFCADRFLKSRPIRPCGVRYEDGCCPIEVPETYPDTEMTNTMGKEPDDWLESLGNPMRNPVLMQGGSRSAGGRDEGEEVIEPAFAWSEKVRSFDHHLRGFIEIASACSSDKEAALLLYVAKGVWDSHDPAFLSLAGVERAWRKWVRAGLCQAISISGGKSQYTRKLVAQASRWKRHVPAKLRGYPIAPT